MLCSLLCGSALPSEEVPLGSHSGQGQTHSQPIALRGTPLSKPRARASLSRVFWGSSWHCMRLLDNRVIARMRVFCPKVEHHMKAALPSHQGSLWWALLLGIADKEGCSPAIAGLSVESPFTAHCVCWCQDLSVFSCFLDREKASIGLPGWNSLCNTHLHNLRGSIPIRMVFPFVSAIASFLSC